MVDRISTIMPSVDNLYEPATPGEAVSVARSFLDSDDCDFWPKVAVSSYDSVHEFNLLRVGKDGALLVDMMHVGNFLLQRLSHGIGDGDSLIISPCSLALIVEIIHRREDPARGVIDILDRIMMDWNCELHKIGIDPSYRFSWSFVKTDEGLMPPVVIRLDRLT